MSPWRFTVLAALLVSCEPGTDPPGMDGFEYCKAGEVARGHRSIYNADDSLIRHQTYGSDGKMFYEYTYQYAGGRLVAATGRGFPPGPGRRNEDIHYSYEKFGNRNRFRVDWNGTITCSDQIRDTAARVIRVYPCDSDQLLRLSVLDSLGRNASDSSYSGEGTVYAFTKVDYDDSGRVSSSFTLVDGSPVLNWTLAYDTRGRPRYEKRMDLSDSLWMTTTHSRVGSLETFETLKEDGTRLERGYSDLSPTGKPLKTIRCFTY